MKKSTVLSSIIVLLFSSSSLTVHAAENGALKASDQELDALSAEANETNMKEVVPANPVKAEPAVVPTASTDVDALSESVTTQLSGILGSPDSDDEKKTEDKLEKMVSSALLDGVKMDDLRSAVSAAMDDIKASEKEGVSAEQVTQASESLSKLVGKADDDNYLKHQKDEANAFASSIKPSSNTKKVVSSQNTVAKTASGVETVTVLPGESLYKIALRVYGSGDNYVRLYEANKSTITDPNIIQIGQVLRVPR